MSWNDARIVMIQRSLRQHRLDAVVCALPANVLMLNGYWPIVGTAMAIATSTGKVVILAPNDEEPLARRGFAQQVVTFETGSLERLLTAVEGIEKPLRMTIASLDLLSARIGCESGEWMQPASYASIHLYGDKVLSRLEETAPKASLVDAHGMLTELRSRHTPAEIDRIRASCVVSQRAYRAGAAALEAGLTEVEAADEFRRPLFVVPSAMADSGRADGFVFCMSGPNAATAYGAYARSRGRTIDRGDLVLVHCNSYVDGYWTDITRTFCIGSPTPHQQKMYDAIFAARDAAMQTIRPGVRAADVDRAARNVLSDRGFGDAFKHPTGHGVGLDAIDHNAPPRLHPLSPDVLEEGMVFNVEPGIYLHDQGIRHCDMVVVTRDGYELLTPFHQDLKSLVAPSGTA